MFERDAAPIERWAHSSVLRCYIHLWFSFCGVFFCPRPPSIGSPAGASPRFKFSAHGKVVLIIISKKPQESNARNCLFWSFTDPNPQFSCIQLPRKTHFYHFSAHYRHNTARIMLFTAPFSNFFEGNMITIVLVLPSCSCTDTHSRRYYILSKFCSISSCLIYNLPFHLFFPYFFTPDPYHGCHYFTCSCPYCTGDCVQSQ